MNRRFNRSFTTFGFLILAAVLIAGMNIDAWASPPDPVRPLLVYGVVRFDGLIEAGGGFSVTRQPGDGIYVITFTDAAGHNYDPNACTATPVNRQCISAVLYHDLTVSGELEVQTSFGPLLEPTDCGFTIICIK
jgi:hypothetical protein